MNRGDQQQTSECSSQEEVTIELQRPKIDRLLKEKVNLKKIIINVALTQYPVVSQVVRDLGWAVQEDREAGDWDVCWTDFSIEPSILIRMHFHQKINHFPGIHLIARKNLLGSNLMAMKSQLQEQYQFFPSTWMLPTQYSEFRTYFESVQPGKTRTYIVKPQADCQGRGIFLTRNIKDLQNGKHYVIQRYVTKPYLIDGLKFDLRIYVLLAGSPLRAYVYEEGLARLATVPYEEPNASNMDNMCMHLTNYAINKLNPNFIFNTSNKQMGIGHKRSLSSIYKLLEKKGQNVEEIKAKINDIIVKTILTGMPSIDHQYRHCQPEEYYGNMCFHVLGFDVMLNSKCQPLLIQVNHTPSFTTDTPLDHNIKYKLIRDSLNLMNINTKTKTDLFNKAQQYNQERLLTGKRQIYHDGDKPKQFIQAQKQRDNFENNALGGFTKIHPVEDPQLQAKYDKIYNITSKFYFDRESAMASVNQKQGKKSLKDQNKDNKRLSLEKKRQLQGESPDFGRNLIYRTNPNPKKILQNMSQPKSTIVSTKTPLAKDNRKSSLNRTITKSFTKQTKETVKNSKGFDIKLIQSEIVFHNNNTSNNYGSNNVISSKNVRLSIKQKRSLKVEGDDQRIKSNIKIGTYVVPKIFNLGLDSQRKQRQE